MTRQHQDITQAGHTGGKEFDQFTRYRQPLACLVALGLLSGIAPARVLDQARCDTPKSLADMAGRHATAMAAPWDTVLLWYLEWINEILTNAQEELDALESPQQWMADVADNYTLYGVPDNLDPQTLDEFHQVIEDTRAHLATSTDAALTESIADFDEILVEMKGFLAPVPAPEAGAE